MSESKKTQKKQYIPPTSPYTYYILCRKCCKVNVPETPGLCPGCAKNNDRPRDNYRPKATADIKTKRWANKCGALPWVYRSKREDHEMCHLTYGKYFISVRRQEDRKFCYIVGDKEETVMRENITELVFARTRSVRHLAKILNMSFEELCNEIMSSSKGK
jgi:hypothetical protein